MSMRFDARPAQSFPTQSLRAYHMDIPIKKRPFSPHQTKRAYSIDIPIKQKGPIKYIKGLVNLDPDQTKKGLSNRQLPHPTADEQSYPAQPANNANVQTALATH